MRSEIRALQQRLGLTMVYVTHDQAEAMTMADLIVVMNAGRIEQVATPRLLYARPQTVFVGGFIGTPPMNLIPRTALGSVPAPQGTATIGIRPEDMTLHGDGHRVEARVREVEYLGTDTLVALEIDGARVVLRQSGQAAPLRDRVTATLPGDRLHFFDTRGQRIARPDDDLSDLQETSRDPFLQANPLGDRDPRIAVAAGLGG